MAKISPAVVTDSWDDEAWSRWNHETYAARARAHRIKSAALVVAFVAVLVVLLFVVPAFGADLPGCGGP